MKEVAARIVHKQRKEYGKTRKEKQKDKAGKSPDRDLPVSDYQHLTVPQVARKLDGLSKRELSPIEQYEKKHKNRKTLLQKLSAAREER